MTEFWDAYDQRCAAAATRQGLDPMTERLRAEGIAHEVAQTGGFIMVIHVAGDGGAYYGITDMREGDGNGDEWLLCYYLDDDAAYAADEYVRTLSERALTTDAVLDLVRRHVTEPVDGDTLASGTEERHHP